MRLILREMLVGCGVIGGVGEREYDQVIIRILCPLTQPPPPNHNEIFQRTSNNVIANITWFPLP